MKQKLLILAALLITCTSQAQIDVKFGGRIDMTVFGDTHKSIESRGGLQYMFPDKPNFNHQGQDLNQVGQLRFGIASSRLNVKATVKNVAGATATGFVEIDFMGVSDNVLQTVRLRHAYMNLDWGRRSLLFGQTSHLAMVDEVTANTVTFGAGYSISPLNRPVQIQYRENLNPNSSLIFAAAMFGSTTGLNQSYALMPDLQLKYTIGINRRVTAGVIIGAKALKPRTVLPDETLSRQTIYSANALAFVRYVTKQGYAFRLYGLCGEDLSPLSIIGGYAPLLSQSKQVDYGYANVMGVTGYLDFESPIYKNGLQWGIFTGWQQNLGTLREVDLSLANIPNQGIDSYWRVAPRLYYNLGKWITFGLEYMYTGAQWAKTFDSFYIPTEKYSITTNNRVTFLARYKF